MPRIVVDVLQGIADYWTVLADRESLPVEVLARLVRLLGRRPRSFDDIAF